MLDAQAEQWDFVGWLSFCAVALQVLPTKATRCEIFVLYRVSMFDMYSIKTLALMGDSASNAMTFIIPSIISPQGGPPASQAPSLVIMVAYI